MPDADATRGEPAAVVTRWIDSYNARDLEGMLDCLQPDVEYHPFRVGEITGSYRGHDGVREWLSRLSPARHGHTIRLTNVEEVDADLLVATGVLHDGKRDVAPFSAVYHTSHGRISVARHYLGDADFLGRLGSEPGPT